MMGRSSLQRRVAADEGSRGALRGRLPRFLLPFEGRQVSRRTHVDQSVVSSRLGLRSACEAEISTLQEHSTKPADLPREAFLIGPHDEKLGLTEWVGSRAFGGSGGHCSRSRDIGKESTPLWLFVRHWCPLWDVGAYVLMDEAKIVMTVMRPSPNRVVQALRR